MTIDPGTSSVVASSSCSVELLLDIFWAVFTGFSRFLVVVCERSFFYASPRICSSFQNREEPMAYFEKRFCSFLALQKVTNLFGFLSRCFFGFARQELSFGFLPSSLPLFFSSIRFLVILSVKCFLKFSKNLNLNSIQTFIFVNLLISKVMFFAARVAFCFTITTIFARDPSQQYPSMHKCNSTLNNIHGKFTQF